MDSWLKYLNFSTRWLEEYLYAVYYFLSITSFLEFLLNSVFKFDKEEIVKEVFLNFCYFVFVL